MTKQATLTTIRQAILDQDPEAIVAHDGVHDHQTCATCLRTWGAGVDDFRDVQDAQWGDESVCPDPECGGHMGMRAGAHDEWVEADEEWDADTEEDTWSVQGQGNTRWWPSDEGRAEIRRRGNTAEAALTVCMDQPTLGKWHS